MVGSRSHPEVWPGLRVACLRKGRDELGMAGRLRLSKAVDVMLWWLSCIDKVMEIPRGF